MGSADRRCHGVLEALVRCSGEFNDAIDMIFLGHAYPHRSFDLKQIPVKVVHNLHAESTPHIGLLGGS